MASLHIKQAKSNIMYSAADVYVCMFVMHVNIDVKYGHI